MIRRINVLKWTVYTVCIVLLVVFQMQAAFYPKILDVTPLFAIPAVIAVAMREGETPGGIFGIVAGLVWDCGTGRVFGFNALFLMIIGIAVGLFVKFLFRNTGVSAALFTVFFTILHEFITWFFFYYMTDQRDLFFAFLHVILPTTALTLVFALPFYFGARFLNHKLTEDDSANSSF